MTKIILIVVGVIAFLLAILALPERIGFDLSQKPTDLLVKLQQENKKQIQSKTPSGWQIYKNTDYNFSFSYPRDFEVTRHTESNGSSVDGFLITGHDNFTLPVWVYKTACLNKCFTSEIIDWQPKNKLNGKEIIVNDIKGYELNLDGNPDNKGPVLRQIYLAKNGMVIYFEYPFLKSSTEPLSQIKQQILDSFQFN